MEDAFVFPEDQADEDEARLLMEETFKFLEVQANEAIVRLLRKYSKEVGASAEARAAVSAIVAEGGIAGMDENRIFRDWKNDVIYIAMTKELAEYDEIKSDFDQNYQAYARNCVENQFDPPALVFHKLQKLVGNEDAIQFRTLTWYQELAWAHRLRASEDPKLALISQAFLVAVTKDPKKEFENLVRTFEEVRRQPDYMWASEHHYTPEQIRAGFGRPEFVPIYYRHLIGIRGAKLEKMPRAELEHAAKHARFLEESEMRSLIAERAVNAARRTPMSQMVGVISVAMEHGLCADRLVAAEQRFLEEILNFQVSLAKESGLPYLNFIAWLRTTDLRGIKAGPPGEQSDVDHIFAHPTRWVKTLPAEYINLGGGAKETYGLWLANFFKKKHRIPRNLVVDYGFFLVRREFSNKRPAAASYA